MLDIYIAVLLDAACDIDNDLAARFDDHIRCMISKSELLDIDCLPPPLCMT
jgi:hypothetical protein